MPRLARTTTNILALCALSVAAGALWAQWRHVPDADFTARQAAAAPGALVWSDEFSGRSGESPNPDFWNIETGGDGWGNREIQCYTDSARNGALTGDGHLRISAHYEPKHRCADATVRDYTSARITTKAKITPTYGTIEIRAKAPDAAGTWPAFWALGGGPNTTWPEGGEFDILENLGRTPGMVRGTVHTATAAGKHAQVDRRFNPPLATPQAWSEDFHTYAVTWTPEKFSYFFDDHLWTEISRQDVIDASGNPDAWVFDSPFHLVLNLAIGGDFGGPMKTRTQQDFLVDYVRIFK